MNIFEIFFKSVFLVKITILILIIFSIFSWSIIINRSYMILMVVRESKDFKKRIQSGIELSELYQKIKSKRKLYGLEKVFYEGFKIFSKLSKSDNLILKDMIEETCRTMRIHLNQELKNLEIYLSMLGNLGTVSPYVGLFGTIFGIISCFQNLKEIQEETIDLIIPSISESLLTTSLGILVAIPSIMAFNQFNYKINGLHQNYEHFIEEILSSLLQRKIFDINKK